MWRTCIILTPTMITVANDIHKVLKGNKKVDPLKLDKVMDCKMRGHELELRKD